MTFGVDGTVTGTVAGAATATFSVVTANTQDIILAAIGISAGATQTVSSITSSPALTWTKRGNQTDTGTLDVELWYSTAWASSGTLSITPHLSASGTWGIVAIGIQGAITTGPWDPNSGLPNSNTGAGTISAATITTTNANDILIGVAAWKNGIGTVTVEAGWTLAGQARSGANSTLGVVIGLQYKSVSAAGSATVNPTFNTSQRWGIIADAVTEFQSGTQALTETFSDSSTKVLLVARGLATPSNTHTDTHTLVTAIASGLATPSDTQHDSVATKVLRQAPLPLDTLKVSTIVAVASGLVSSAGTEHDTLALVASGLGVGAGTESDAVVLKPTKQVPTPSVTLSVSSIGKVASGIASPAGTEHETVFAAGSNPATGSGTQSASVGVKPMRQADTPGVALSVSSITKVAAGVAGPTDTHHDSVSYVVSNPAAGAGRESDTVALVSSGKGLGAGTEHDSVVAAPMRQVDSPGVALSVSSITKIASGTGVGAGTVHDSLAFVVANPGVGAGTAHDSVFAAASGKSAGAGLFHTSVVAIAVGPEHASGRFADTLVTFASGLGVGAGRASDSLVMVVGGRVSLQEGFAGGVSKQALAAVGVAGAMQASVVYVATQRREVAPMIFQKVPILTPYEISQMYGRGGAGWHDDGSA